MTVESIIPALPGRDILTHEPSDATYVVAWYNNQQPLVGEPAGVIWNQQHRLIQRMYQTQLNVRAQQRLREGLKQQLRDAGGGGGVRLESFRQWVKAHLPAVTQVLFLKGGAVVVDYVPEHPKPRFLFGPWARASVSGTTPSFRICAINGFRILFCG